MIYLIRLMKGFIQNMIMQYEFSGVRAIEVIEGESRQKDYQEVFEKVKEKMYEELDLY